VHWRQYRTVLRKTKAHRHSCPPLLVIGIVRRRHRLVVNVSLLELLGDCIGFLRIRLRILLLLLRTSTLPGPTRILLLLLEVLGLVLPERVSIETLFIISAKRLRPSNELHIHNLHLNQRLVDL
jgi:hypothetical protein